MAERDLLAPARERFAAAGITDIDFPGPACPVPDWLNLDACVSPEVRGEIVNLIIEGKQLEATVRDFSQRVRATGTGVSAGGETGLRPNTPEAIYDVVATFSGREALYEIVGELVGQLEAGVESDGCMSIGSIPDWAKDDPNMYPPPEGPVA
jgi:hypothetical protein